MEILITAVMVSVLNIACFFIGAKIGQKVDKGEMIRIPDMNPFKVYEERRNRKEAEAEQRRLETVLGNIERYDGTDSGQQDIPR